MKHETKMRPYQISDIDAICLAVEKYLPELPHYKNITVSKERLAYLLRHNFGNASYFQCWVLVNKNDEVVGGVAGYCTNGMVTWDLIANDVFLYVFPEYRTFQRGKQLVEAYKKWAQSRGAVLILASVQSGYEPDLFDKFMKMLDFRPVGTLYHLRLDEAYIVDQLNKLKG